MTTYDSIEAWAEGYGLTLDEALEAGVSQRDDGTIDAPPLVWSWAEGWVDLWKEEVA